ncbi:MAG: zinc-ribbon domain-containing protein [Oscillospiraceae bacterium]|nr:zinc-ribbon domain-containing protein [Oscillospiraceae bacterium]
MFCHSCGSSVTPGSRFCGKCGAVLQYVDAVVQEETPERNRASEQIETPQADEISENEESPQADDAPIVLEPPAFKPPYQQTDPQVIQPVYPQNQSYPQNPPYPQSPPDQQNPLYQQYQPYQQPPVPPPEIPHNTKPSKKVWKIIVPVVAAVALIATALLIYFLVFLSSPTTTVFRALSNVGSDIEERLEGTPLELFGLLFESLQDGSVSVDFDHRNLWSETRGSVMLHSDGRRGEYALEVGLTVFNISMDLDVYLNRDVAAARLRQVDNNYYGIVFDTFEDDFRSFARVLDLDRTETDEIVNAVEMLADFLRGSDDTEAFSEEYGKLLGDFVQRLDVTSERIDIMSGGNSVRAQKIDFIITDRDIADLFEEFFDILENDENIRAMLESNISDLGFFYTSYDDFIREMRREVRSFTRSLSGEITVTFYIGSNNRLLRIEIGTDLAYEGEVELFDMSVDFGASATDIWTFEMNVGAGRDRMSFTLEWEMRETSHGSEVVFRGTTDDRWSDNETGELTLSWTDRGNFTLSYVEDRSSETILSGVYTRNSDGFRLEIDDPFTDSFWDESLSLTISASNSAGRIEEVNFINIADWGETLLERFEDFLGFGDYMDVPWIDPPDHGTPPPVDPPPPPGITDPDLIDHELLGAWSFSGGVGTYFFWWSELVYFDENAIVMADDEFGLWSVNGNELTVISDYGQGFEYKFSFEIVNGVLYITDSDNDTGEFERLW